MMTPGSRVKRAAKMFASQRMGQLTMIHYEDSNAVQAAYLRICAGLRRRAYRAPDPGPRLQDRITEAVSRRMLKPLARQTQGRAGASLKARMRFYEIGDEAYHLRGRVDGAAGAAT